MGKARLSVLQFFDRLLSHRGIKSRTQPSETHGQNTQSIHSVGSRLHRRHSSTLNNDIVVIPDDVHRENDLELRRRQDEEVREQRGQTTLAFDRRPSAGAVEVVLVVNSDGGTGSHRCGLCLQRIGLRVYVITAGKLSVAAIADQPSKTPANIRFGDEILEIECQSVGELAALEAVNLLEEALRANGNCALTIRRQPLTRTLRVSRDVHRTHWADAIPDGHVITTVNGKDAVGLPNEVLAHMVQGGGLVEVMDSLVFESLSAARLNGTGAMEPLLSVADGRP